MNIIVSKDIVKLNENHSENHYGEYNVNECVFEFDEYLNSVPIKKAIFTSQSNNKSFEIDIINNKCTVPHEVLTKVYDTVILGVYGYDVNEETLLVRYSPEPTTFVVHEGSYREGAEQPEIITPTQYDMYSKALQEGLAKVNGRLDDVEKQGNYASEQGNYAKEQGDYAKEQGNYAKEQKIEVVKANEEANRIINNFETNVSEYTTAFNENVANKTKEFNANVSAKTSAFDNNAILKNEEFNENANSKKTDFNLNANNRTTEFDTNVANQTKTFNDNASDRLVEYNQNDTTKTNAFNSNANSKTETYNNNHTEKLNAYNTNADTKLNEYNDNATLKEEEYNSNATARMEEFNQIASDYDERITANEEYLDTITPKQTAKGELVHITDALPLPTFENKVDGNVKQETTTGKNLLNVPSTYSVTGYNERTINIPSGTYVFSATKRTSTNSNTTSLFYFYEGQTQVGQIYIGGTQPLSKTLNLTGNANRILIYSAGNYTESVDVTTTFENLMISKDGGTYEPFTNGASPNPNYEQPIEVIEGSVGVKVNGKNLLYWTRPTFGTVTENEDGSFYFQYGYEQNLMMVLTGELKSGTYTITNYGDLSLYIQSEKGDYTRVVNPNSSMTFTYDGTSFLRLTYTATTANTKQLFKIQLESGSNSTPYEPYKEQITYLDLKGNWAGAINDTIKDYLVTDKKKFWLVKNVGKVVLDGSESGWFKSGTTAIDRYGISIDGITSMNLSSTRSTHFIYNVGAIIGTYSFSGTNMYFDYGDYNTTTLDDFKTWLSTHNVEVYYALAKQQIIELGKLPEPIKTFEGTNNIQVLANLDTEIEVKYGLDVKKYFDNKLAEISAQII